MEVTKDKVSAKRCADLMGIAIANQLSEVWIVQPKALIILYLFYCFPNIFKWYIFFTILFIKLVKKIIYFHEFL